MPHEVRGVEEAVYSDVDRRVAVVSSRASGYWVGARPLMPSCMSMHTQSARVRHGPAWPQPGAARALRG